MLVVRLNILDKYMRIFYDQQQMKLKHKEL